MSRSLLAFSTLLLFTSMMVSAQPTAELYGSIEGNNYISPNRSYSIQIPILPELGGTIEDTPTAVVFRDAYNVHVSIGAFPQDASQRWELSTTGLQEYLPKYFSTYVMPDFVGMFPGSKVESAAFAPNQFGGALLCFTLMPGGSMFLPEVGSLGTDAPVPVAKRGNLVFIYNHTVYVISVELAERVIVGTMYSKTTEEEDAILKKRLQEIVSTMRF